MRWTRREYLDLVTGRNVQRQMFCELFGPLVGLEEQWRAQGAAPGEIDLTDFCWDTVDLVHVGSTGFIHTPAPRVLEDTPEYIISVDSLGRKTKLPKGYATIALPLDFPVKDMDSWLKMKPMLTYEEGRVDPQQLLKAKKAQENGALVIAGIPGGFDVLRELMGDGNACLAYYDDPELVWDILNTVRDTAVKVLERVTDVVGIDILSVHEDMAGKSSPLIGPNTVREFIKPYYRAAWDLVSARGTQVFSQDSDGHMVPVIDAFIECGVTNFYPCEPAAGMDIVQLRKKYGHKITFKGGIDKHVLRKSKREIREELEYKMQPLMLDGGVVFGIDHRIPNGTPIENYRYYVEVGRELLGREPVDQDTKGWVRMAF